MNPDPVPAKPPQRAAGHLPSADAARRAPAIAAMAGAADAAGVADPVRVADPADAAGAADPLCAADPANAARHVAAADPACGACQIGVTAMAGIAGDASLPRSRAGRGSWLLASAGQRMAVAVLVSAALWGLTAWAMGWW